MTTHSHDPGPFTWHPAIDGALRDRAVLREALERDGQLVHHVRLLSLFLTALDRRHWRTPANQLAESLAGDLLPSDRELLDAQTFHATMLREMERGTLAPVVSTAEPCPECRAGKHQNCTGQTMDASDELVPCPCTHDGRGVLVMPTEQGQS